MSFCFAFCFIFCVKERNVGSYCLQCFLALSIKKQERRKRSYPVRQTIPSSCHGFHIDDVESSCNTWNIGMQYTIFLEKNWFISNVPVRNKNCPALDLKGFTFLHNLVSPCVVGCWSQESPCGDPRYLNRFGNTVSQQCWIDKFSSSEGYYSVFHALHYYPCWWWCPTAVDVAWPPIYYHMLVSNHSMSLRWGCGNHVIPITFMDALW